MAIYQETSAIQSTTASGIITSKRSIDTNVLVDDGQIIVLGGLIDDNLQDGVEKVPGLGDIPVIGNLFKYQKRNRVKTNLMVFLRPTVIRSNEQSVNVAGDRYNYIRNAEIGAQPEPTLVLPNLGAPLLPPLNNGQLVDGPLYNPVPPNNANVQEMLRQQPAPQVPPLPPGSGPRRPEPFVNPGP
jgi:general secretion pathway protein D